MNTNETEMKNVADALESYAESTGLLKRAEELVEKVTAQERQTQYALPEAVKVASEKEGISAEDYMKLLGQE